MKPVGPDQRLSVGIWTEDRSATAMDTSSGVAPAPENQPQDRAEQREAGDCAIYVHAATARERLIARRLVGLEIMHLTFLAARGYGHADASAGVGAARRAVPAFFIGVDQIAIFAMHHALAGDQGADIAPHIQPDLLHVLVEMAPACVGWQLGQRRPDVQVGGGVTVIQEALAGAG